MKEQQDYFSQLPTVVKGVIAVGVLAGVAFAGYQIYTGIKSWKDKQQSKKDVGKIESDLDIEIKAGHRPKYSDSQYSSWASELKSYFSGCGSETDKVVEVFKKLHNKADVLKLISAYGVRTYSGCTLQLESDKTGTLNEALASELDSSELARLNNILKLNAVNYQF